MKIVVNRSFGGFSLSEKACRELGLEWTSWVSQYSYSGSRTDPKLVEVVERLGAEANGEFARLEVVEIPDDVDWEIGDDGGVETVRERSRSW